MGCTCSGHAVDDNFYKRKSCSLDTLASNHMVSRDNLKSGV